MPDNNIWMQTQSGMSLPDIAQTGRFPYTVNVLLKNWINSSVSEGLTVQTRDLNLMPRTHVKNPDVVAHVL